MFILKRQDVEISSIQHPSKDQTIPILSYQGQTFRLVQVFNAGQGEEAKNFWRDLTDNKGKACVLLQEPDRHSVWGKIHREQVAQDHNRHSTHLVKSCLLIAQDLYLEIEDLLGKHQAQLFKQEISNTFRVLHFPQTETPEAIEKIFTEDPLISLDTPTWDENHLVNLLQELHRLGKVFFGNTNFAEGIREILEDVPDQEQRQFFAWLHKAALDKLWY